MSDRRTIARNTVFNALGRLWEAAAGIGLTIYMIDRVGLEGFGLWSLVAVFTGYAALFDFGVSSAFTKFIASFATRGDRKGVSAVVSTGVYFYALLGVIIVALGWPLIDVLIAGTLKIMYALNPGHTQVIASNVRWEEARSLLRGALLLFAAGNCAAPFSALQSGLQRMGLANAIGFASSIVKVVATAFFLEAGMGVLGLLYASAVVLAFTTAVNVAAAYRIFPGLHCNPRRMEWPVFTVLLSFGWRSQVARLANLINFQTDRMVVALVSGGNLDLVGLFRVGEDLAAKVRQAPMLMVSALVPAVSSLDARGDRERLRILYLRSTKYVAAVTAPAAFYFLGSAEMLLSLYADKSSLGQAAWVARIIILGYVMNVLPGPGVSIALGKGNAGLPMVAGLISMAGNIVLTVVLYWAIGFYGIPLGTALSLGLSTVWFFAAMRREVAVPPLRLLRESLLWPVVASLPGFALCAGANWALAGYDDRIVNLMVAAICGGAFVLSYAACLRWAPFLDRYDVAFLRETLRLDRVPGFRFLTARAEQDKGDCSRLARDAGMESGLSPNRGLSPQETSYKPARAFHEDSQGDSQRLVKRHDSMVSDTSQSDAVPVMRILRNFAEKDGRGYPDWAVRYLPILRRFRGKDWAALRILEIGANENGFARFSGARVVALDLAPEHLRAALASQAVEPVAGDIGALPFGGGTFDVVICLDTYEHIPAEHRKSANREIVRVLRRDGVAVIGFPSGAAAFAAEGRIRAAYGALTGGTIRWLEEHVAMGLPDGAAVEQDLAAACGDAYTVERTGNGAIWMWEGMWRVLMCNWPGRGNALAQVLLRLLVPVISRMHGAPCYRAMLWVRPMGNDE